MKNIKVWAIELFPGANLLYVRNLEESDVGDTIRITVREMTQEKYDNLPEWDGP